VGGGRGIASENWGPRVEPQEADQFLSSLASNARLVGKNGKKRGFSTSKLLYLENDRLQWQTDRRLNGAIVSDIILVTP